MLNEKAKALESKANGLMKKTPQKLLQEVISKLPQVMFVILPIFALLLKLMYFFSNRLYMEHLTVALHSHSFIFLAFLVMELGDFLLDAQSDTYSVIATILYSLIIILTVWVPVYLFMMQKRVYKQGYFFTLIKFSIVSILYFLLLASAAMVAFVWGLISS